MCRVFVLPACRPALKPRTHFGRNFVRGCGLYLSTVFPGVALERIVVASNEIAGIASQFCSIVFREPFLITSSFPRVHPAQSSRVEPHGCSCSVLYCYPAGEDAWLLYRNTGGGSAGKSDAPSERNKHDLVYSHHHLHAVPVAESMQGGS